MIHPHYDSEQILWFVRNYWKYTREKMLQEYRHTFHDANFGKSQYQWLKARYGMKEEWGASLNNPPYSGARPGGPGTENYEPPDIPAHAPQMIFRTRSDSPTPNLVLAPPPPAPMDTGGQAHASGVRNRVSSSGSLRAAALDSCDYPDGAAPVQTPTHTAAGTPGFPTSNLTSSGTYVVPGQINSLAANGLNGTYTFGFQDLGSPFVPAAAQMGSFNPSNVSSMATLNAPYTMPASAYGINLSSGVNPMLGTENHAVANTQQPTNCLTGSGSTDHLLLAAYPFTTAQPFQSVGGQYGATFHSQAATDSIAQQYAFTGLGIDNQNYLGSQVHQGLPSDNSTSRSSALTNIGNMVPATNMNPNAYRGPGSGGNDQLSLQGSHAGSPASRGLMETTVSPRKPTVGPITSRKRKLVEVECRPPTLPSLLDPALQAAKDSSTGSSPASSRVAAATQMSVHGGESPVKKIKSAKSSVTSSSSPTATAAAPGSAENTAAAVRYSPSARPVESPKTPMPTLTSVGSHSAVSAAVNPSALASVSHSTDVVRRVPEAPAMQAQRGSLALAQVMGMHAGNASAAANMSHGTNAFVLHDYAALSQLQTPSTSRTHSLVMPANSRSVSRDTVYTSAPPSIAASPNDKSSGVGSRVVWPGMQAPAGQENPPQAANYIGSVAPVEASTVTPAVTSYDETSSGHGADVHSSTYQDFSFGDYSTIDFTGSSVDLGPMLQDTAGSASLFNDAMDKLLFGDSFPGEAHVAMNAGVLQDIAAADHNGSSSAGSNVSDAAENPHSMPTMFGVSSHGSGEPEASRLPFSSCGGSPSTSWFE